MTPPEIALWLALRKNEAGLRFRKQHPAEPYVLDFYCAPALLAIEVDGEAHARGDRPERDATRDAWLKARDVRVLRYTATDVLNHTESVVGQIVAIAIDRRAKLQGARQPPLRRLRRHLPLAGRIEGSTILPRQGEVARASGRRGRYATRPLTTPPDPPPHPCPATSPPRAWDTSTPSHS
nr:endonuclease domain-containing protein [uncultured Sphingomonas sp.]